MPQGVRFSCLWPPEHLLPCAAAMLRTVALVSLIAFASVTPAAAQFGPTASGEFRTSGSYYENFFQTPGTGVPRDVWVASTEIRFEDPLSDDNRLRAYTRIEFLQLRDIGSSPGATFGVRRRGKMHRVDVNAAMQWNRPRSDVGDELEQADLLTGNASYTLRVIGLELTAESEYRQEFLRPNRVTASRFQEAGASIGYRAFGGRVVPEIGMYSGRRDTGNAKDEYDQVTKQVGLRVAAIPHVSLDTRYRLRHRDYTIQDIRSKNFGRDDRREQFRAGLDIALNGPLVWNLFGAVDKGTSTRKNRNFETRSFGTGFTLRY